MLGSSAWLFVSAPALKRRAVGVALEFWLLASGSSPPLTPMNETETRVASLAALLPGTLGYCEIEGLPIALANVGGTVYAFSDTCRHQGGPLSAGVLRDETVTCPWHGWTYHIRTGKAIVPPVGIRIPTYAVRIDGDDVFVTVNWVE